jgi:hypothetical protein
MRKTATATDPQGPAGGDGGNPRIGTSHSGTVVQTRRQPCLRLGGHSQGCSVLRARVHLPARPDLEQAFRGCPRPAFRSTGAGFLTGLWAAAGATAPASQPAILAQNLTVQANPWFGVQARTNPTQIVWVYLNYATDWAAQFSENTPVQSLVESEVQGENFPHYDTFTRTELMATQINLLAHLSSWSVVSADTSSGVFSNRFTSRD